MRNINLVGGSLEKKYGRTHIYDTPSIGASIRLLEANHPGFKEDLREGHYRLIRGEDVETGEHLVEEQINMNFGSGDFYIVATVAGSDGKSWGMIIAGVVLVAAAFALGPLGVGVLGASIATSVGMMGVSLILGGISLLMAPEIPENMNDREDTRTMFTFGGPVNRTEQGRARPLIFGQFVVGSYVIQSSLHARNT